MLPTPAKLRLQAMQALLGSAPRRDLRRVVVEMPDQCGPTIRLFGLLGLGAWPSGRRSAMV